MHSILELLKTVTDRVLIYPFCIKYISLKILFYPEHKWLPFNIAKNAEQPENMALNRM